MYSKKVKEFVRACVDEIPKTPRKMTSGEKKFIIRMIQDEVEELQVAESLEDEVDALVDIIYYIIDRSIKNGIDLDPIFDIVHQANMKKVVNGQIKRRQDGKILKPENWEPPEPLIIKELEKQARN